MVIGVVIGGVASVLVSALAVAGAWAQGVVTPTELGAVVAPAASPSVPQAPTPFQALNVEVRVTETTGFARDTALERAARQSLPTVIHQGLGLPLAEAQEKVAKLGDPMKFVKQYNIVKESVLPFYQLRVNLVFNEEMLRKNFGGLNTLKTPEIEGPLSSPSPSVAAPEISNKTYIVQIDEPSAAGQDRARRAMAGVSGSTAVYTEITVDRVTLTVTTAQSEQELKDALAGVSATIVAAAEPLAPAEAPPSPENTTAAPPPAAQPTAQPAAPPSASPPNTQGRPAWLPSFW